MPSINSHVFELEALGVRLRLRHDGGNEEQFKEAETVLGHQLDLTRQVTHSRDPLRIAILTAFRLVSDLMTERSERALPPSISVSDGAEIERLVQDMLQLLRDFPPSSGSNGPSETPSSD